MSNKGEFLNAVCTYARTDRHQAEQATGAVLSSLRLRLTSQEAEHVEAQLPSDMIDLWKGDLLERARQRFGSPTDDDWQHFVGRVAEKLECSDTEAEHLTRAVFHVLKDTISAGEVDDIAAQLPKDMQRAWELA